VLDAATSTLKQIVQQAERARRQKRIISGRCPMLAATLAKGNDCARPVRSGMVRRSQGSQGGHPMNRAVMLTVAATIGLSLAGSPTRLIAAETGTAEQAKAMLEQTVAAIRADEPKALAAISKGEAGFKDRDLYAFCAGPDGKIDAHPNPALLGNDMNTIKDKTGKLFGQEILRVAEAGKIATVDYMWPKLGTTEPVPKQSYVTKINDQVCGVGYYK
jgi:hypothetical protein